MRYLALLRGINVGGNNIVDMKELKAVFEAAGMSSVRTYINSGNVIFSADAEDQTRLSEQLERAIARKFDVHVRVLVLDVDQVRGVVESLPAHWANNAEMKCDVLFLWDDVDRASVLDDMRIRPEIEDVRYVPGAVIWRVDRKNATRSSLPRIVGTPLYKSVTVRNCNTARKLLTLMED